MAQAKKAKENKQTSRIEDQDRLQAVNTPPSRQAGNNQPQNLQEETGGGGGGQSQQRNYGQSQGMTRGGGGTQNRGLSRREQFSSPFSFMRRFSEEMDRLFEDFGFGGGLMAPGSFGRGFISPNFERQFERLSRWSPQTEVFERGNELVVRADLPGMTKDDINVEIEDDQIIIRGERRDEHTEDERGFYHTERSYGSFYRSIPLPQGLDSEQAKAGFRNGVLEITMPKPEQKSRARRIEIGEGGNEKANEQPPGGEAKTTNQ